MAKNFQNILLGAFKEAEKRRDEQSKIQATLREFQFKQQLEAQSQKADPVARILKLGELAQAFQSLGLNFSDFVGQGRGMQGGQGGLNLGLGQQQAIQQPSIRSGAGAIQGQGQQAGIFNQQQTLPSAAITSPLAGVSGGQRVGARPRGVPQLLPKKFVQTPLGGIKPTEFVSRETIEQEKLIGKSVDITGKQFEEFFKTNRNLVRVKAASQGLVARGKQAVNEMGGFGVSQFVRAKLGQARAVSGLFDIPVEEQFSGLAGFEGQLVEMTLALSPILTGQNRIIRGIVNMLKKTLPKFPTSEAQFTAKLRQTNENAFRLSLAISQSLVSLEDIQALNSASDEEIQIFLENTLNKNKFDPESTRIFNKLWGEIKATPASKPEALFAPGERQFNQRSQLNVPPQSQKDLEEIERINKQLDRLGGR